MYERDKEIQEKLEQFMYEQDREIQEKLEQFKSSNPDFFSLEEIIHFHRDGHWSHQDVAEELLKLAKEMIDLSIKIMVNK